jgi:hypothetical protein
MTLPVCRPLRFNRSLRGTKCDGIDPETNPAWLSGCRSWTATIVENQAMDGSIELSMQERKGYLRTFRPSRKAGGLVLSMLTGEPWRRPRWQAAFARPKSVASETETSCIWLAEGPATRSKTSGKYESTWLSLTEAVDRLRRRRSAGIDPHQPASNRRTSSPYDCFIFSIMPPNLPRSRKCRNPSIRGRCSERRLPCQRETCEPGSNRTRQYQVPGQS